MALHRIVHIKSELEQEHSFRARWSADLVAPALGGFLAELTEPGAATAAGDIAAVNAHSGTIKKRPHMPEFYAKKLCPSPDVAHFNATPFDANKKNSMISLLF